MKKILLITAFAFVCTKCANSQFVAFSQIYIIIHNTYYNLNAAAAILDFNGDGHNI